MRFFRKLQKKERYTFLFSFFIDFILGVIIYSIKSSNQSLIYDILTDFFCALTVALILYIFFGDRFRVKLEDSDKLSENYDNLCSIYKSDNLFKYIQKCNNYKSLVLAKKNTKNNLNYEFGNEIKSPIIQEKIIIDDNHLIFKYADDMYELPAIVIKYYDILLSAHSNIGKNNNIIYRVDYIENTKKNIIIHLSRTQYFYSLVTNRAMDYMIGDNFCLRDLYVLNNSVGNLATSLLSNHLGFNAVVETTDNKIVFVKRSQKLSIEKNNLGLGIQASVKCINQDINNNNIKKCIYKAIYKEAKDELNVIKNQISSCNVISIYRNLVEGGKPQLLVYIKLNITSREIYFNFLKLIKAKRKNIDLTRDGNKLYFLSVQGLLNNNICILPDGISGLFFYYKMRKMRGKEVLIKNKYKWFDMVPSSTSSLVMWLDYINNKNNYIPVI